MEWKTVILRSEDGVATIVLNRPEQFNALDFQLGDDLIAALEACIRDDTVRAVVLTGSGKAFCSGGDLKMAGEFAGDNPSEPYRQLTKRLNRIITEIRSLDKPVIAAINGAVGGAGLSIAAACDLRIASSAARFRQAYTNVGLVPDGGWMLLVPLLIGLGRASELLFLDPVFDAQKALEIGLVNRVVEPGELAGSALEWAGKLAGGPSRSFAIIKNLLNNSLLTLLERQLELERQGIIKAAGTGDYAEGLKAFFEKRAPQFTGR
ncbi:MAG: enoyl-CoA hydratase/isomerase family protein [Bacillota bacterium]